MKEQSLHIRLDLVLRALHAKRERTILLVGVADWEYGENRLHRAGVFAKTNAQNLIAFVVDEGVGRWMADNSPTTVLNEIGQDFAVVRAFQEILSRSDDPMVLQPIYEAVDTMLRRLGPYIPEEV